MTQRILASLVAIAALAPSLSLARQAGPESQVPRMSLEEFRKGLKDGTVLAVDVRDAPSFALGHIPGAVSVPLDQIKARAASLKASKKVIVTYCA